MSISIISNRRILSAVATNTGFEEACPKLQAACYQVCKSNTPSWIWWDTVCNLRYPNLHFPSVLLRKTGKEMLISGHFAYQWQENKAELAYVPKLPGVSLSLKAKIQICIPQPCGPKVQMLPVDIPWDYKLETPPPPKLTIHPSNREQRFKILIKKKKTQFKFWTVQK